VSVCREVEEWERIDRRVEPCGQPRRVLVRLQLDVDQAIAGRLGLECTDGLPFDEEQVVGEAVTGGHPELAHGHAPAGGEVHVGTVLDDPAGGLKGHVDLLTGLLLGSRAHAGPLGANDCEATRKSTTEDRSRLNSRVWPSAP